MNYNTGNESEPELQTNGLATVLNKRESAIKGGNETHGTEDMKAAGDARLFECAILQPWVVKH